MNLPQYTRFRHSGNIVAGVMMILCLSLFPSSGIAADSDTDSMMSHALSCYHQGDNDQAIEELIRASDAFQKQGQPEKQIRALIEAARIYQVNGWYGQAETTLDSAMTVAKTGGNTRMTAWVSVYLANLFISTGRLEKAYPMLEFCVATAKQINDRPLQAVAMNHVGHGLMSQKKYAEALDAYRNSAELSDDSPNAAFFLAHAATASLQQDNLELTLSLLNHAGKKLLSEADSRDQAFAMISVGQGFLQLWTQEKINRNTAFPPAYALFKAAETISKNLNNPLMLSYSDGYLGRLYELDNRYEEALSLTRSAVWSAQQTGSSESLYLWMWQTGRLLARQGDMDGAMSAYRRAVDLLESIRSELTAQTNHPGGTFRTRFGSLYLELVDLLLRRSETGTDPGPQQLLSEARDRMEQLKVAELQDYFQDECVVAYRPQATRLDTIAQGAVVIYPILLPDRTDMLVSLPGKLVRIPLSVDYKTLEKEVRQFRIMLEKRITRQYLAHSQKLYQWLIAPIEAELNTANTQILVIVPDGPLRTIPLAALHDGKQFLIHRYAIAVTPGLYLSDPQPINRQAIKVLSLGLTEATQGFPALPYVAEEVKEITAMIGGRAFLNQDFLMADIQQRMTDDTYSIVHIASHSHFSGDKDHSYILTYDDRLTLEQMDQCLGVFRFRQSPLDILTLSACETAVGDDRAALGLAGVAVKAGARSALASLWSINDQASSLLVAEFYRQLLQPEMTRAKALQSAQKMLMADPRYAHPVYWAPFLLINNWL